MAAAASVTVYGTVTGLPTGSKTFGATITSAVASGHTQNLVLAAGFNAITNPATPAPTGVVVQLPTTNTSVTTLKGVTGDTGIAIGKIGFIVLTWDAAALPTWGLTSVSAQTGLATELSFF